MTETESRNEAGVHKAAGMALGPGCIPFILRVGVTGHRDLDDTPDRRASLEEALEAATALFPTTASTPIVLCAVSAMAEGADRLVAHAALRSAGGMLEAALPLSADRYREDFATEASRTEFDALLGRAVLVVDDFEAPTREESYARAGRYVVNRCDVLVALWDGRPSPRLGGTAETVAYALRERVPVVLVPRAGGTAVVDLGKGPVSEPFSGAGVHRSVLPDDYDDEDLSIEVTRATLKELDDYNANSARHSELSAGAFGRELLSEANELPGRGSDETKLRPFADWLFPYFVRADRVAIHFERRFNGLVTAEFGFAALAVFLAAFAQLLETNRPWAVPSELVALGLAVAVVVYGRSSKAHLRWLASRFLAERFRSALFLRITGLTARRERPFEGVQLADPSEDWLRRAYSYVWYVAPVVSVQESDVDDLRRLLSDAWIRPQIQYCVRQGRRHDRRHRAVLFSSVSLFVLTAVAVIIHLVGVSPNAERYLVLGSIAFPALASALTGIGARHQHQRHAATYRRMAHYLEAVVDRISRAITLGGLQSAAFEADEILRDENRDWLSVMRFHDFDVPG